MANDEIKPIEVNIAGTILQVKNDNNELEIQKATDLANRELEKIRKSNPNINRIYLMVMGCMNLADMYCQSENNNQVLAKKIRELTDDNDTFDQKAKDKDIKIEQLTQKIDELLTAQNSLKDQLNKKNDLLNQYRDHIKQIKDENDANRKSILNLQNKLFESQIELNKSQDDLES